ncbi:MAG: hypothetical protein AAGH40_09530 [Verrucomicrobiota bacterium]
MTSEKIPIQKGMTSLVDIVTNISYRDNMVQADYPDFIEMKALLEETAKAFGREKRKVDELWSWQSLPPALCKVVLDTYPNVTEVSIALVIAPNYKMPFSPTVACEMIREGKEFPAINSVEIPIEVFGIEHQGPNVIDLVTTLFAKNGASTEELPRFKTIRDRLITGMEEYPIESDYWETLIKALSADLLSNYPSFDRIEMFLNVHPTSTLTYPHEVTCVTLRKE